MTSKPHLKRRLRDICLSENGERIYKIKKKGNRNPLRVDLGLPGKKVLEEYVRNGYVIEPEYDTTSLSAHVVRYWAIKHINSTHKP